MIRTFVRDYQHVTDQRVRLGYVRLECWTSIAGNLVLGTAKLILGLVSGSIALTADAAHTYGDMVSSVVLLGSMRLAASPPDRKHPHGHGRAEALGTLVLAGMLLVTALEFAHPAFDRLLAPDPEGSRAMAGMGWSMVPILVVFGVFKEWMARFSADLGLQVASDALAGDAQHHRSDALATLLVLFSFVGVKLGYPRLDGVFGLGVALFIGWAGVSLGWNMVSQLLGEAPSPDLVAQIVTAAASVRGVRGVHGITVHDYGNRKVASLHVEVAADLLTEESHRVATLVEQALLRRLEMSAVVHVEVHQGAPYDESSAKVIEALRRLVAADPRVLGFHAVHVTSSSRELSVDFHLIVIAGLPIEECHQIEHRLTNELTSQLGLLKVGIHCEPATAETTQA